MTQTRDLKIAIVCDSLDQYGGAEKIVEEFHQLFPTAPIFTAVYKKEKMKSLGFEVGNKKIIVSNLFPEWVMQKFGKYLFFLYPLIFETFNFSSYDLVISSSSRFAHTIITPENCIHICYMHAPARYAWDYFSYKDALKLPFIFKQLYPIVVSSMRVWDRVAADRIDYIIANSTYIQKRIAKFYRKESVVINPFVAIDRFLEAPFINGDYYIYLGRLIPIRKIEILIEAFNENKKKLYIVGNGNDLYLRKLKQKASTNISFFEKQSNTKVIDFLSEAKALLWPGIEDFGMAAIEAQAAGKPVIAYKKGGSIDTIIEGETGIFFEEQTISSINNAVASFEKLKINPDKCRANAMRFSKEKFDTSLMTYITKCLDESCNRV